MKRPPLEGAGGSLVGPPGCAARLLLSDGDGQARQPPFRESLGQPARPVALRPKPLDGLRSEDAIRTPAVGDDLGALEDLRGHGTERRGSRDPAPYLQATADRRLTVMFSAERHLHADFVSGSGELAAEGAEVLAGAASLAGELAGGMAAGRAAGLPTSAVALLPAASPVGTILDIRQDAEFSAGHIPGALHVELGSVVGAEIPATGPLTLVCGHGERAMSAASLLEARGRRDLAVVAGGPADWATAHGRALETG